MTRAPRCTFDTVLPVVQALQCTADDKLMWITAVPHSRFGEYAGMGLLALAPPGPDADVVGGLMEQYLVCCPGLGVEVGGCSVRDSRDSRKQGAR